MRRVFTMLAVGMVATSVIAGTAQDQEINWTSLITTSSGMVLVDTTSAPDVNRTLDNIRTLGFDPTDIRYVFITHAHDDHYGGGSPGQGRDGSNDLHDGPRPDFSGPGLGPRR